MIEMLLLGILALGAAFLLGLHTGKNNAEAKQLDDAIDQLRKKSDEAEIFAASPRNKLAILDELRKHTD